jgi:hypothetical protein
MRPTRSSSSTASSRASSRGHSLFGLPLRLGLFVARQAALCLHLEPRQVPGSEDLERSAFTRRHAGGGQHQALPAGRPPGLCRGGGGRASSMMPRGSRCSSSSGTAWAHTSTSRSRPRWPGGSRAEGPGAGLRHRRRLERQQRIRHPRRRRLARHGFGTPIPMHRARPLHSLLMTRASFEAQARHAHGGEPVFSVTRAGPPGLQRYAQTWSGDNTTSWETPALEHPHRLADVAVGHVQHRPRRRRFCRPVARPELFLRWVQACCLNPRMVMNSWKADGTNNVPWLHPQVTEHVAAAIRLRYTLMPYLWSLFERASSAPRADHPADFLRLSGRRAVLCDDFMRRSSCWVAQWACGVVRPCWCTRPVVNAQARPSAPRPHGSS